MKDCFGASKYVAYGGMSGVLALAESDPEGQARIGSFRQQLQKLGWAEGRNVHIEDRWPAADVEQIRRAAAELVALAPDVIFINSQPGFARRPARAARSPSVR